MEHNPKKSFLVRRIEKSDYNKIPAVYASAFDEPAWEDDWHDIPQFDVDSVWIAAHEDEIVGFLISFFSKKYSVPYISVVATASSYKKQGIGTALVVCALNYWKNKGFADILVHTDIFRRDALGLYKKCGFKETETAGGTVTLYKKL